MKNPSGISDVKFPDTYCPWVLLKARLKVWQLLLDAVAFTLNALLNNCCGCDCDVTTLLPVVEVITWMLVTWVVIVTSLWPSTTGNNNAEHKSRRATTCHTRKKHTNCYFLIETIKQFASAENSANIPMLKLNCRPWQRLSSTFYAYWNIFKLVD